MGRAGHLRRRESPSGCTWSASPLGGGGDGVARWVWRRQRWNARCADHALRRDDGAYGHGSDDVGNVQDAAGQGAYGSTNGHGAHDGAAGLRTDELTDDCYSGRAHQFRQRRLIVHCPATARERLVFHCPPRGWRGGHEHLVVEPR
jgi:hypothetical protein